MQNHRAFVVSKFPQSPCAVTVNAGLTMQVFHQKPIALQAFADFADIVQYGDDTPKLIAHPANHLIDQHFRATNSQRVDDMADRWAISSLSV
jgi:hypothetical protein